MTALRDGDAKLRDILTTTRTIAVVGASPDPFRPSHGVMAYLQTRGYKTIPVNPTAAGTAILGEKVYARLADIPGSIDMVDIFRRSADAGAVVDEAIHVAAEKGIRTIWMQLGISDDAAAKRAEAKGLTVVMDRCTASEHRRLVGR